MKKLFLLLLFCSVHLFSQSVAERIDSSVKTLLASAPMLSGSISIYVTDGAGSPVYEFESYKGLSPASTMKIFTAATAMETLGRNYTYSTKVAVDEHLYITSNGDPTLGSWRYEGKKPEDFISGVIEALKSKNIKKISGNLILDDGCFDFQKIPGGWPYNDMGNYYGAGVWGINWRENQFDIQTVGKDIKSFSFNTAGYKTVNEIRTEGSSDRSIIYTHPYSDLIYMNGTLPAKAMTVSGALPNPPRQLANELIEALKKNNVEFSGEIIVNSERMMNAEKPIVFPVQNTIYTHKSPPLEKIVYWFLRKSVNLYGETLVKTLAREKTASPSFGNGMKYLKDFWIQKGIDTRLISFSDGSGLSPQNYVATKAEVQALLWAQQQPWFQAYFEGFPVQGNGMKMKSGSIKDCRAFAGYHTSADGRHYVFSVIMNNYQATDLSDALYRILNNLK